MNAMSEEYSPWLIGVIHTQAEIAEALDTIKSVPAKKVGIELHRSFFHDPYFLEYDADSRLFWEAIVDTLKRKKIEIVFLMPEQLRREIDKEGAKAKSTLELMRNTRWLKLVNISLTREMIATAKREKPDLIMVGAFHAAIMRKDLRVRKERFRMILPEQNKEKLRKITLHDVRVYRKYEALKRKIKMKQKQANQRKPNKRR